MINGSDVRPKRWEDVLDLFDNGKYSAIWGRYDGGEERILGVRWNGEGEFDKGYPKAIGHPVWYNEPDFLRLPILVKLLDEVRMLSNSAKKHQYIENIKIAIAEATQDIKSL